MKILYTPNCKKVRIRPTFKLFYDLNDNVSIFSKITFDSTMIETINGNLFDKTQTNVGRFAITNTIYDINDSNNNGLFEEASQTTLYLQKGNIQFSTAYQVTKDSQGNYIFPSGKTVFKILSGTGVFLNAKGFVVINSNGTLRKINIYIINQKIK